jgi:Tfp pilus assembly protein FimT
MTTKGADQRRALSKVEELKNKVKGSRGAAGQRSRRSSPAQEKTQAGRRRDRAASGKRPRISKWPRRVSRFAGNTFLASYCNHQCKKREGCPPGRPSTPGRKKEEP